MHVGGRRRIVTGPERAADFPNVTQPAASVGSEPNFRGPSPVPYMRPPRESSQNMEKRPGYGFVHALGRGTVGEPVSCSPAGQEEISSRKGSSLVRRPRWAGWFVVPLSGNPTPGPLTLGPQKTQSRRASCPRSPSQEAAKQRCEPKGI